MTQGARQKDLVDPTVLWTYCCFLAERKSLCGLHLEQSGFQLIHQNNRAFKFGMRFLRTGFRWLFLYRIVPQSPHSPESMKAFWHSKVCRSSLCCRPVPRHQILPCPGTRFCHSHPQRGLRIWLNNWSVVPGQKYASGFLLRSNPKILTLHRSHHDNSWVEWLLVVLYLYFLESTALSKNSTRLW